MNRAEVDFHLDPMFPFAYQTSVWPRELTARHLQPDLSGRDWVGVNRGQVIGAGSSR
ncbi:MAG: hypothetical protein M3Y33_01525 [Actinomycetota bacterium]|nr:hypothetical protein [Actinomycetota bacterium]